MGSFQKYFISVVLGILVIILIVGTVISLNNKSGFTDGNTNPNPQLDISASQLAIGSYVGIGLLVIAGVAILAISLRPRV
jgi:hypothetical protein